MRVIWSSQIIDLAVENIDRGMTAIHPPGLLDKFQSSHELNS